MSIPMKLNVSNIVEYLPTFLGRKWIIFFSGSVRFPRGHFIKSQEHHDILNFDWNKIFTIVLVVMDIPDTCVKYSD